MAAKYEEIKLKRNHMRNLTKTSQTIVQLKQQRNMEEKSRQFLRKLNLLRLESLHVLQGDSELALAECRFWELAFLHSETLARLEAQLLTPERYAILRQRSESQNFAMHLVFSDMVCIYLFGQLMQICKGTSIFTGKSLSLHSKVCQDNLQKILIKIEKLFKPADGQSVLIQDIAEMTEKPAEEIVATLTCSTIKPDDAPEQQKENVEAALESLRKLYNAVLGDMPEHVLDEDYENREKFVMKKMELGILNKLNKAGLPALINASKVNGGGILNRAEPEEEALEEEVQEAQEEPEEPEE